MKVHKRVMGSGVVKSLVFDAIRTSERVELGPPEFIAIDARGAVANPGDWIVTDASGARYAVPENIFALAFATAPTED